MTAWRVGVPLAVVVLSVWGLGFAEGNPITVRAADLIAMETDALRLPCPDWWVDGVVDLHGPDSHPECMLFEYQDVSLVRTQLDRLVRYQGLGQWASPWSQGDPDGANRYIVISSVGFLLMLWPQEDNHTLLNVTMPPADVQESIRRTVDSD